MDMQLSCPELPDMLEPVTLAALKQVHGPLWHQECRKKIRIPPESLGPVAKALGSM